MERLTIGQMAEKNQVTKKALLLYQEQGLLEPEIVDAQTGYRYYSMAQCSTLDMIQQLKNAGLSLKEIKEIVDQRDILHMQKILEKNAKKLVEKRKKLELAQTLNDRLLNICHFTQQKPQCEVPTLEWVEEQKVLVFPTPNYRVARHFSDEGQGFPILNRWEESLRCIQKQFVEYELPMELFYSVGCVISLESILARAPISTGGFIFNSRNLDCPLAQVWEAGWALTVTIDRTFDENGIHQENKYIGVLLDIADQYGMTPRADYYCEILAETPAFLYEARDMMMRMRIPVTVKHPERCPCYVPPKK